MLVCALYYYICMYNMYIDMYKCINIISLDSYRVLAIHLIEPDWLANRSVSSPLSKSNFKHDCQPNLIISYVFYRKNSAASIGNRAFRNFLVFRDLCGYYLNNLLPHTASTICDFEQNSASFSNDDSVFINNLDSFPEFCLEDLGKNSVNLNDVVHYITQLRHKSSLYSCLETVRERKRIIAFPKGYFNPAIKLQAMHNYLLSRFNDYNKRFFVVLKSISKLVHFLNHRTRSHGYADVYEDGMC